MPIELTLVISHTAVFLLALALRLLLDLELAQILVKYCSWLPYRTIFRRKDFSLAGKWDEHWETTSSNFPNQKDRHSHPEIKQLGPYCYAEPIAKGVTYCFFGKISGEYLLGNWYQKGNEKENFGVFQLRIRSSELLEGLWLGHSSTNPNQINANTWRWEKIK